MLTTVHHIMADEPALLDGTVTNPRGPVGQSRAARGNLHFLRSVLETYNGVSYPCAGLGARDVLLRGRPSLRSFRRVAANDAAHFPTRTAFRSAARRAGGRVGHESSVASAKSYQKWIATLVSREKLVRM